MFHVGAQNPAMTLPRESFDFNTLGGGAYCWLDFDDASTLFQDTGATTPVTKYGQSILRINDKSGNGRNWTNASSATSPIWDQFVEAGMSAANFLGGGGGNRYLSSALPATFNILYRGGPFTLIFHLSGRRRRVASPQVILDTTDANNALNGCGFLSTISGTYGEAYYMYLSNSLTHKSGTGKNETTVHDPEYEYIFAENSTTAIALGYANDVNNAYIKFNSLPTRTTASTGSPAAADSPYAARLGASANTASYGWLGMIRRMVVWNSYLSATDFQTAMDKVKL